MTMAVNHVVTPNTHKTASKYNKLTLGENDP